MIDINLIPSSLRKEGKRIGDSLSINIPKETLWGVGLGLGLLLLTVHLLLGGVWLMSVGRLSLHQAQWQKLQPDKTVLDAIHKESGDLQKKIKMITEINKSILWAPKFNAISDCLPKEVWIRKMTLDKNGLTIEGSVVSKTQNEINSVGLFLAALRNDEDFIKDFSSLEVNSIQGSKNNSVEVTDFSVMAKLK